MLFAKRHQQVFGLYAPIEKGSHLRDRLYLQAGKLPHLHVRLTGSCNQSVLRIVIDKDRQLVALGIRLLGEEFAG